MSGPKDEIVFLLIFLRSKSFKADMDVQPNISYFTDEKMSYLTEHPVGSSGK